MHFFFTFMISGMRYYNPPCGRSPWNKTGGISILGRTHVSTFPPATFPFFAPNIETAACDANLAGGGPGVSRQLRLGLELCCCTSWDELALSGLVLFHSHPVVPLLSGPGPGGRRWQQECARSVRCFPPRSSRQTQHCRRSSN